MNAPQLVIGIDGGGTKTAAWVALSDRSSENGLRILGRGYSGASNLRAVGTETAFAHLTQAVNDARREAGLINEPAKAATVALAGADRQAERELIDSWAVSVQLADHVQIVNDALPLLYAAEVEQPHPGVGIALICGTGSLALGRNASGHVARSGGWGFLIGDEGSAFSIGRAALQAVSKAVDGRGPETKLVTLILNRLQLEVPSDMIQAIYGAPDARMTVAGLADLVLQAASEHDAVACQIVDDASCELSQMVSSLFHRLQFTAAVPLFVTGGVLLHQPEFRAQLLQRLRTLRLDIGEMWPVPEAVLGAVRMASQLAWQF